MSRHLEFDMNYQYTVYTIDVADNSEHFFVKSVPEQSFFFYLLLSSKSSSSEFYLLWLWY